MTDTVPRRSALRLLGGALAVVAAATGAHASTVRAAGARASGARPATAVPTGAAGAGRRAGALLEQLTLDEKISLLHGATDPAPLGQAGYVPGVKRLGIPPLRLADGPAGVRVARHATALPAPVLLAAAFDPALARRYGEVIGREGRALGQDVLLSPMVNLIRTPYAGRNFETFGEDPLLAADLVAAEIRGVQDAGLIATVKHFALNNQEQDRMTVDVRVDERTLHEVELRAFEAAVTAGAGAVMGAYNKVNGVFACENPVLLSEILRERWGFEGWVMTDWSAARSTVASITAGLDMEMPDGRYFGAALAAAVRDGRVPEKLVDASAGRLLGVMERFGLLDGSAPPRPARDPAAGAAVALEVAKAGATLLRNARGTLPLDGSARLAVIGASASHPFVSGGGSAHVVPDRAVSPLDALRARAASVTHALGEDLFGKPLPATLLTPALAAEHRTVAAGRTWTYDGTLTLDAPDEWTFVLHFSGDPARRPSVRLDGTELFPQLPDHGEYFMGGLTTTAPDGLGVRRATRALTPGAHRLAVTAEGGTAGLSFRLRRISGTTRRDDVADAVRIARAADRVVLFAHEDATEGRDRTSLSLPGGQDRLIEAVTAANPRTTVVLNTSSATAMPWLEGTGAVLQMYYPGQEGAAATTAVLYGDCDPGGRLTQTFPADDDHHPVAADTRRYPGENSVVEYSEGVHLGHRWYDARGVRPLFPFGHGMSYTSFAYEGLRARRTAEGAEVVFAVRNTGGRSGIAVPQVYLGPSPELRLEQPVRVLAGYRRLTLGPGERREVSVRIDGRTLSSWDPQRHGWVLGTGRRTVWVGASSGDLALRAEVEITGAPSGG
ncbi:glycoside hydrolase family 3 C-terminal domain-containing protein [Streptomyces sp. NPDC093252]|uniref:beta-glucosidase family protein n=1 Tax=Streptomyces sp. NPDC093252 TaxID=3154980 RepID=UPI0034164880